MKPWGVIYEIGCTASRKYIAAFELQMERPAWNVAHIPLMVEEVDLLWKYIDFGRPVQFGLPRGDLLFQTWSGNLIRKAPVSVSKYSGIKNISRDENPLQILRLMCMYTSRRDVSVRQARFGYIQWYDNASFQMTTHT